MKLTPDELAELDRSGIWRGRHKRRFPLQNGNSHQRRKVRRASWREAEKRVPQKPRGLIFLAGSSDPQLPKGVEPTVEELKALSAHYGFPFYIDATSDDIDLSEPDDSPERPYPPENKKD